MFLELRRPWISEKAFDSLYFGFSLDWILLAGQCADNNRSTVHLCAR